MISAGIDLGSAAVKIVFVDDKYNLLWSKAISTSPSNISLITKLLNDGLEYISARDNDFLGIATTGYGRNSLVDKKIVIDEITAISKGLYHLTDRSAKLVINIGGQDIKCIEIGKEGKVVDFKMNDKCAAGTGRFLEKIANILNMNVEELNNINMDNVKPIEINSTCAIFVESEILSFLYKDIEKKDIIAAVNRSISRRICDFIKGFSLEREVYLDGGPALNRNLVDAIQEELAVEIKTVQYPQLTAAIGAAIFLLEEKSKNK